MSALERALATGPSQAALARHLGVSEALVSRWRSRRAVPSVALLRPLAAPLGNTPDDTLRHWADIPKIAAILAAADRWQVPAVDILALAQTFSGWSTRWPTRTT